MKKIEQKNKELTIFQWIIKRIKQIIFGQGAIFVLLLVLSGCDDQIKTGIKKNCEKLEECDKYNCLARESAENGWNNAVTYSNLERNCLIKQAIKENKAIQILN